MKVTGIFEPYEPIDEDLLNDARIIKENTGMDIFFLRDSNGELWHEAQYCFKNETLKVAFDKKGVIIMLADDATLLNPVNCAVAEIKKNDVPAEVNETQEWMYADGKIIPRKYTKDEFIANAEITKQQLMSTASTAIAPLQDAVDIGEATEAEIDLLQRWKKYRVLINRIDINDAPDIKWPDVPVAFS